MKRFIRNYLLSGVFYTLVLASKETYDTIKKYGYDETCNKLDDVHKELEQQSAYETIGAVVINSVLWPYRITKVHFERMKKLGFED